ncbi:MAG: hypothetical protein ILA17_06140 [Ruminococcus sp.]|nr:hypothetical protein [Ruminiclostridium sp.]MBP1537429.1 hypothetical protein [Ruminococcus sp.]
MPGINHTLEYYCERYIEKPTCARYDALAEKVVNLSEGKIANVILCAECKNYNNKNSAKGYGECSVFGRTMKDKEFCCYGKEKNLEDDKTDII